MEVLTKYSPGDLVFTLDNGTLYQCKITEVEYTAELDKEIIKEKTKYRMLGAANKSLWNKNESELFESMDHFNDHVQSNCVMLTAITLPTNEVEQTAPNYWGEDMS